MLLRSNSTVAIRCAGLPASGVPTVGKVDAGGDKGGEIVAIGLPEEIIKSQRSYTARYLRKDL